ncbi:MAG: hypothetical protein GKR87_13105 [Kiritimatiellae bacterium]|nr:hypothetical protein [Kiritimatiellia bacterium]
MQLVNNCLKPGLWEVSASDFVGEMFDGCFQMPQPLYYKLVQEVNGLDHVKEEALRKSLT